MGECRSESDRRVEEALEFLMFVPGADGGT